ncbi:hypothetical protein GE300_17540 [Rhodobacteraceae bacterium 2CG4]|uniref:Lipoprotein n=1 Tax=Halovulum marinum TaxID=2662447 RepID=A0A6L5Z4A7_9RHOB|nr:hypothetical protein [Halovulum marinum]MSU91386.1 hypothetical protein [Halovulum marinum]
MRWVAVLAVMGLTGCSWLGFGGGDTRDAGAVAVSSRGLSVEQVAATVAADGSVLVDSLAEVVPEPALRGVILRASSVAPTQGYYGAALVAANRGAPDADGIVTYAFRALPPPGEAPVGPARSRLLTAAVFVPDAALDEIRGFRVLSRTGTVDLRR